jgi:hypothetical protein
MSRPAMAKDKEKIKRCKSIYKAKQIFFKYLAQKEGITKTLTYIFIICFLKLVEILPMVT